MAGLLRRIGSVLNAGAHDALDGIESPDAALRQLVRRATDDIVRVRTLAIEAVASEKRLGQEIARHRSAADDLHAKAGASVEAGDETTARTHLAARREHQQMLETLEPQHARAVTNSSELKSRLQELDRGLERLRGQRDALTARRKGADALRHAGEVSRELVSGHEVGERLALAEAAVVDLETRNIATTEIDLAMRPATAADRPAHGDDIERELNELRSAGG